MASPQLENGYTKIANEIMDSFIGSRVVIPSEVRRIVDFVIRKTYGFNKISDTISLTQFALSTRIKKPNIIRAIKKAILMNLIIRTDNKNTWKYRFNKDFDTWKPLSPRIINSKSLSPRITNRYPHGYPQKKVKENILKGVIHLSVNTQKKKYEITR